VKKPVDGCGSLVVVVVVGVVDDDDDGTGFAAVFDATNQLLGFGDVASESVMLMSSFAVDIGMQLEPGDCSDVVAHGADMVLVRGFEVPSNDVAELDRGDSIAVCEGGLTDN
jgi:hypothetical protein